MQHKILQAKFSNNDNALMGIGAVGVKVTMTMSHYSGIGEGRGRR